MPSVYSRSKHLLQTMTWHHHHRIVNVSSSLMQQRCIESGLNICVLQFNYCIPRSSCQIIYDNSPCCSCALAPRASISLLRDAGRRSWLSPRVQQIPVHFTHHTSGRDVAEQNAWENMQVETKISSSNTLTETKARMSVATYEHSCSSNHCTSQADFCPRCSTVPMTTIVLFYRTR